MELNQKNPELKLLTQQLENDICSETLWTPWPDVGGGSRVIGLVFVIVTISRAKMPFLLITSIVMAKSVQSASLPLYIRSLLTYFYQSPQKHETLWLKHEIVFFRLPMMSESELAKRKGKEREKEFYVEISIFSYLDRKKRGLIVSC